MTILNTLLANMRHAVRDRQDATIGGGYFTYKELKQAVIEIDALRESLKECEPRPDAFDFGPAYEGAVARRKAALKGTS